MEIKVVPTFTKSIQGRDVTGIFAVHGVVDYVMDRSWPGSFQKTIKEGMGSRMIKYLWSHNLDWGSAGPPVAVITGLEEIPREQLPEELLSKYPESTGGVQVSRKYLSTVRGDECYQGLVEGAITEQSYGFDPVPSKTEFTPTSSEQGAAQIRELREVKLWEVSDVLWGANPATMASKIWVPADSMALMHIKAMIEGLLSHLEVKGGARHNKEDRALLKAIHRAVKVLEPSVCKAPDDEDEDSEGDSSKESESEGDKKSLTDSTTAGALPPLWDIKKRIELLELGIY